LVIEKGTINYSLIVSKLLNKLHCETFFLLSYYEQQANDKQNNLFGSVVNLIVSKEILNLKTKSTQNGSQDEIVLKVISQQFSPIVSQFGVIYFGVFKCSNNACTHYDKARNVVTYSFTADYMNYKGEFIINVELPYDCVCKKTTITKFSLHTLSNYLIIKYGGEFELAIDKVFEFDTLSGKQKFKLRGAITFLNNEQIVKNYRFLGHSIQCLSNKKMEVFTGKTIRFEKYSLLFLEKTSCEPAIALKMAKNINDSKVFIDMIKYFDNVHVKFGIRNKGNTCFIASAVQTLLMIHPYVQFLVSDNFESNLSTLDVSGKTFELNRLMRRYAMNTYKMSTDLVEPLVEQNALINVVQLNGINPSPLVDLFKKAKKLAGPLRENDSSYYFTDIFQILHKELQCTYDNYQKIDPDGLYADDQYINQIFEQYSEFTNQKFLFTKEKYSPIFANLAQFISHDFLCTDCKLKNTSLAKKKNVDIVYAATIPQLEVSQTCVTLLQNFDKAKCDQCKVFKFNKFVFTSKYIFVNVPFNYNLKYNVKVPDTINIYNQLINKNKKYEVIVIGTYYFIKDPGAPEGSGVGHFRVHIKINNEMCVYNDANYYTQKEFQNLINRGFVQGTPKFLLLREVEVEV
jgi:ubiquitin C-terminal hydrolase